MRRLLIRGITGIDELPDIEVFEISVIRETGIVSATKALY